MSHNTVPEVRDVRGSSPRAVRGVRAMPHGRRDRRPPAGRAMARHNGPLGDDEAEDDLSLLRTKSMGMCRGARVGRIAGVRAGRGIGVVKCWKRQRMRKNMTENETEVLSDDAQRDDELRRRVFAEPDREVWVVERNPGSAWRVSAVLGSYEDAERYKDDLRKVMNSYPEDFPEEFKNETEFRIRYNSRRSGTKYFENYPPEDDRPTTLMEEMLG